MNRYLASINNQADLLEVWEKIKDQAPFDAIFYEIRCKYCDSKDISKYGRYKNMQQWWCKNCKRKFTDNRASPGMKVPSNRIQSAISMYYKGIPIATIRQQLKEDFNYFPSESSVHKWLYRYAERTLASTQNHRPQVGNVWMIFESSTIIGSDTLWVLDLIDISTHFLLSCRFSTNLKAEDFGVLIRSAGEKAQKIPDEIIAYKGQVKNKELYLKTGIKLVNKNYSREQEELNIPDFWRGVIRIRRRIMRGQKLLSLAQTTLNGWIYYYNYRVNQKSLKEKTAAQEAGIVYDDGVNQQVKDYWL